MYRTLKRILDLISATLLLVVISPIFLVLILLIAFKLGRPIFYRQERSGMKMRTFMMIKFRTMTNDCDANGDLLPDYKRQTKFGMWLRSSSLDELPELLNIIKGDMSVIGPRPLPTEYNNFYTKEELNRFIVRGGLITPGSVDKEPIISWTKQFQYELDYVQNLSFKMDVKLFFAVFRILFSRSKTSYGSYVREPLNVERINNKRYE